MDEEIKLTLGGLQTHSSTSLRTQRSMFQVKSLAPENPLIGSTSQWYCTFTKWPLLSREVSLFQNHLIQLLLGLIGFWINFNVGWVLTLIASCSLSFRNQALIAQGLYTPTSLLVRRIRMDLWCFHQDYHSHYTTLYSHVRTKDSCRIRRMPPPALSLLTILLLHLGSSIRLHITEA